MRIFLSLLCTLIIFSAKAATPVWTFTPLTATTLSVPTNATATIQYLITNQSSRSHTLIMNSIPAITQMTGGAGVCRSIFTLSSKGASCVLSLQVDGSKLMDPINDGPIVCESGNMNQCYRPSSSDVLQITSVEPPSVVILSVAGSPLTLNSNGPTGNLTITNTSLSIAAFNIASDFTGTALDGNVTEIGNTCSVLAPNASCILTYTPGSMVVPLTDFTISGANTATALAAIEINDELPFLDTINPPSGPAAGGTGVTLNGSNLTGVTSVTFDGVAATSVNVISSSTVTAVTPAHTTGGVDVMIDAPQGSSTLTNGFIYTTTALGQSADGGVVGCLNGGQENLISAVSDNSLGIEWGGFGSAIGATSDTDGASNTIIIVSTLGLGSYAAALCSDYEVDSQGNSPCEAGNTCYNDWFLPAQNQLNCLYTNKNVIGGFQNVEYRSSTENSGAPTIEAFDQDFSTGTQNGISKNEILPVRCVSAFTP